MGEFFLTLFDEEQSSNQLRETDFFNSMQPNFLRDLPVTAILSR